MRFQGETKFGAKGEQSPLMWLKALKLYDA
jgi:hypothetical protein